MFTADLRDAQAPAEEAITALVLDAPLPAQDKIALARGLGDQLDARAAAGCPTCTRAFAALQLPRRERAAAAQLERDLDDQLERAATRAFRNSFLIGAGLRWLALLPLIPLRRRVTDMTAGARVRALPVLAAVLVSGVLGVQVAHGGGDFTPPQPADPCAARTVTSVSTGIDGLGERLVLLGLDGAACRSA